VLNLVGVGMPLLVAVIAIPPLVRGLGTERFGILTLIWAAIGYFSLFELGLSRALTQAVAERLGNGHQEELPSLTWSALLLLFGLGIVGAIVTAAITPLLISRVLNVPPSLSAEAETAFYVLAISLPIVVTSVGLRGIMEAHQHFGAVTALRLPLIAFMFLGPLAVLPFSRSLVPAVIMLALGRVIGGVAHLVICIRRYAFMRQGITIRGAQLKPLLRFGGWTTVSNIVSPMMVYLDRFLIGALLPIAAVAHYVTPYEIVTKLLVIPGAIVGAMFPAFAATYASDSDRMARLYERSLRAIVIVMFPIALFTVALAREGLSAWVGSVLPHESAVVLQWLAVGVFINAMGQPPYGALQGAARPDLVAKLHLFELPFYAVAIWLFVQSLGIEGVAIAWTLRVALDSVALLVVARRTLRVTAVPKLGGVWSIVLMVATLAGVAVIESAIARVTALVIVVAVFVRVAWVMLLVESERDLVRRMWRRAEATGAAEPAQLSEVSAVPPT
jgi:O-antigen/teichoic acid export membrane protein